MAQTVFFKVSARVPKAWRNSRGIVAEEIRNAVQKGAAVTLRILRFNIRLKGATATRNLVNGAASRVVRNQGLTAWYTRELFFRGPAADYWEFVDKRRRAGKMPVRQVGERWEPFEHVEQYLRLRGIPASRWFVVMRAMAAGFKGHHFVAETVQEARPLVRELVEDAIAAVKKRLGA